jgi:hypothetical protein
VTIIPNISALYAFFAAGYQRWFAEVENEHGLVECVITEPPWRNRYRLSGSEYPTAPTFPRYQY